jgi:hypothetical protein
MEQYPRKWLEKTNEAGYPLAAALKTDIATLWLF